MPNILKSLFFQVVIALGLGIALGMAYPDVALQMKPLGDGFIKLIKMLVPVIVFCVVVHGIAAAGDLSKVGRVGVRALVYFEVITTIALMLGIALAYYFEPGVGMNIDPKTLDAKALSGFSQTAAQVAGGGVSEFLMKLIPSTVVGAFTTGDILQVLIVSIMFGCAVSLCGERAKPVADFIGRVSDIVFKMMNFVVRLAPIGVFGAIAFTVGKYGIGSLKQLGGLVALFYVAVVLFVVVVLGDGHALVRLQPVQAAPLLARGTDDCSWHGGRRQRAAADHAEARTARHQAVDRWVGHSDRILVQSRCVLDLPDAGRRIHCPGHQHAAGDG